MCLISGAIALATTLGTTLASVTSTAAIGVGGALGLSTTAGTGLFGVGSAAAWGGGAILATAAGMATAAGALGTVSSVQQAMIAQESAENAAQMAEYERQQYAAEEYQITEQAAYDRRKRVIEQQQILGQGKVAGAAAGVQLGTGSMLDWEVSTNEVFEEDLRQFDYDVDLRQHESQMKQWRAAYSKDVAESQADLYETQIPLLATTGVISTFANTTSTLLSLPGSTSMFKTTNPLK